MFIHPIQTTPLLRNNTPLPYAPYKEFYLKGQPNCDQVQFSGKHWTPSKTIEFALKDSLNLPCAYCGEKMLNFQEQRRLATLLANSTGITLQNRLSLIRNSIICPIEQGVSALLLRSSTRHPKDNIQNLFIRILPHAKTTVRKRQKSVLDKTTKIMADLEGETKIKTLAQINELDTVLHQLEPNYLAQKKRILGMIYQIHREEQDLRNRAVLASGLESLTELPTSRNCPEAFVLKYCGRTPMEIAERLYDPLLTSVEHIDPQNLNGASTPSNYLLTHRTCNQAKDGKPFDTYIEGHAEIIPHIKKYVKAAATRIVVDDICGLETYPTDVARTLHSLSRGKIVIDLSDYLYAPHNLRTK